MPMFPQQKNQQSYSEVMESVRTDYIDLYPNNVLNHTCAPENIPGHFGLLFLRAPYKFQFYLLTYLLNPGAMAKWTQSHVGRHCCRHSGQLLHANHVSDMLWSGGGTSDAEES